MPVNLDSSIDTLSGEQVATFALLVSYDGSLYSGFAKQKDEGITTVQGELERALATVFGHAVDTVCAGRTDAGVHARGQVVSFDLVGKDIKECSLSRLRISLNALTPDDISIRDVCQAPCGFSARFDALRREYRYRIVCGSVPPLFLRSFAWWHRGLLDACSMHEAAQCLVGEHDFLSFCKAVSAKGKSTKRRIEEISVFAGEELGEDHLVVRVVGNAFLHSMVRSIVGTLVEVGSGRRPQDWVASVLEARDRRAAGQTAPACGLTFWHVDYQEGLLSWQ